MRHRSDKERYHHENHRKNKALESGAEEAAGAVRRTLYPSAGALEPARPGR